MSRQFSLPLRRLGHGLDWIFLLVIASCGLSALQAQFSAIAYWNCLLVLNYAIVFYALVNWIRQCPELKQRLWYALCFSGALTHLLSVFSWRPNADMWIENAFASAIRNPFPLGHHNFVGGYCVLMLPLTVGLTCVQFTKQPRQRHWIGWRWLGCGAIALNCIALYISGSRGALLGAVALGAIALPLYCFSHRPQKLKHWLLILLSLLVISGAVLSNPRVRSLTTFNPSATATASWQQIDDGPTKDRLFMLQAGSQIFRDHPLLGVGPGNLSRVYNRYRPIETGGGLELVQQLHNTPAQLVAELGLLGFVSYGLLLAWLLRTGAKLQRKIKHPQDRILLYSVGASCFAYAVSSLTDYQLENIGISSVLLLNVVLIVALADEHLEKPHPAAFTPKIRRFISLGLLCVFSLMVQTWAIADAALYLNHTAQQSAADFDYAAADVQWMKASELMPWDPTYAALSAEQLIGIEATASEQTTQSKLREAAIASLKTALKAAPNDPWFHQNLAVLLLSTHPQQSQTHLHHSIRLFPRSYHYTYYTLGRSYLAQQKQSEATTAFVLESLVNPKFLSDSIWTSDPLAPLLPVVVNQTLAVYQNILERTAPNSSQYAWLQRQIALTQWWHHKPFSVSEGFDPLVQAVLAIEENPDYASQLLQRIIDDGSAEAVHKASLLFTWHSPENALSSFLFGLNATDQDKQTLTENIFTHRDLREWFTSVTLPLPEQRRFGLSFAYRNSAANSIRKILFAEGLSKFSLLEDLALFPNPPREFAQLDQAIAAIAQEEFNIPFPHPVAH
ncbi:MAG: O-antigen ligase family protein [Phormidesmis sp.]